MARDRAFDDIQDPYTLASALFVPSQPIREPTRLYGREAQLQKTQRALASPGRSVFVFGERGVGKTSLAQTAAYLEDSTDGEPLVTSCYQANFSKIITQAARHLMKLPYYETTKRTLVREMKLGGAAGHILHKVETKPNEHVTIEPMYAVDVLSEVTGKNTRPVVVIDEVDLASRELKRDFAHFVKQVGDKDCPVRFIFTGIASDVNELLGEHESSLRYVATVKLEQLLVGDLVKIVETGFRHLNIGIADILRTRIALLSDGFAYFTHLLGLKLAHCTLDAEKDDVNEDLLEQAIEDAVDESEVWLKKSYEKAVRKYHDRYEAILWALADHYIVLRSSKDIYQSYLSICRRRANQLNQTFIEPAVLDSEEENDVDDEAPFDEDAESVEAAEGKEAISALSRKQFTQALNRLKQEAHGRIVQSPQKGWHRFDVPMMRGYCRLVAARHGVKIGLKYLDSYNKLVTIDDGT